jgi:tRNA(Arg) A34 adenosine deaminase TadA
VGMRKLHQMNPDRKYLARAVALAAESAAAGGFPSGALVVRAGGVLGEGFSVSRTSDDPTAHAEMAAIRAAATQHGPAALSGAVLYSALEPCLMCLHAAYWGGISRIVCGAGKDLFTPVYYEGSGSLVSAAAAFKRPVTVEWMPGFEEMIVGQVREWEERHGREAG